MDATWKLAPDVTVYIEAVHRLSDFGAVVTHVAQGSSQQGFEAEWREVSLTTLDGDLFNRCELFDEVDLDAALARFDELQPQPRLENAASQVYERIKAYFAARDWDAIREILADAICTEDRRHVVNAGVRHGRDAVIAEVSSIAAIGATKLTSEVIATRGSHLVLSRGRASEEDQRPESFRTDLLDIVEIDADERVLARIIFDVDDLGAAFAELDARYLAGEAAEHAHTWSVITQAFAATNRREIPEFLPDFVNIDHRRARAFAPGDLTAYIRATWDLAPDVIAYAEAVHRLSNLGAVFTQAVNGTSQGGFEAEWREICIATVEGDLINRIELFDEADLDAALARFDELGRPTSQLENAATRVDERFLACFATHTWDALTEILAVDASTDDRRRLLGAGLRHGRDAVIEDLRVGAGMGVTHITPTILATRGDHLTLRRTLYWGPDQTPEAFLIDVLHIIEIDADELIVAIVTFDPDDLDAAFVELESRYAAGEAAAHSHTWSVISEAYVALNRRELAATTPDWVNIDHRRGIAAARGDLTPYIRAAWDVMAHVKEYIEAVHRLTSLGAVITRVSNGTSREGFDAEWREIDLTTVEGDLIKRSEKFDEADLDAALAKFDELNRQAPQLENAATRARVQIADALNRRDSSGLLALSNADGRYEDRRKGLRDDAVGQGLKKVVDALFEMTKSWLLEIEPVAIRGSRLGLTRDIYRDTSDSDLAITGEHLTLTEVDDDDLICNSVLFDPDDIDAAYEELDSRYLTGEAAAHAHTWSVISGALTALHRHELPALTPDCVNIDHRRGIAFAPGDMTAYIGATLDDVPDFSIHFETVHRLNSFGAVVTFTSSGTSRGGFDAEWRMIQVLAVRGDMISRCETFDEEDLDAALEKFDELNRPRLENAASRVYERLQVCFLADDWDAMADLLDDDFLQDDRRRVVGAGARHGRDAQIEDMRAIADLGFKHWTPNVIAIRGSRLFLRRVRYSDSERPDAVHIDVLEVVEIDADERITALVIFDPDDIDTAFAELDARYAAGESAAHARTWSLVAQTYAGFNRRELVPTVPNWESADHRHGIASAQLDVIGYAHAAWDVTPNAKAYVETVHQLSNLGAVVTAVTDGTSQEGFDAEWRDIHLITFEGDLGKHFELFDEANLDAALARFNELSAPAPLLENAATRVVACAMDAFNRRDFDSYLAVLTADGRYEDRRKGLRDEGLIRPDFARTMFFEAPTGWQAEVDPIAIRGSHLALCRLMFRDHSEVDRPIAVGALLHAEVTIDELISSFVLFDPDDLNGAMAELTARWIASGDVAHPDVIEREHSLVEAANRHDWETFAEISADATYVNHRQLAAGGVHTIAAHMSSIQTMASLVPDMRMELAEVIAHSASVAVTHLVVKGTSTDGVEIELPIFVLNVHDGQHVTHMETFDFDRRDHALARFEELSASTPQLENAATRIRARLADAVNRSDLDDYLAQTLAEGRYNDRRKGFRDEGQLRSAARALIETLPPAWRLETEPVAIRGSHLGLTRDTYRDVSAADRPITGEGLTLTEVADGLVRHCVLFDPDDINGAFGELTARWIASGQVAHPEVIEAARLVNETYNRHDWHEVAAIEGGATYVNHRQLASGVTETIADHWRSMRALESLIPDLRVEGPEILTHSATGVVNSVVVKGTTTEGAAIELPAVILLLFDGLRVTRMEAFDINQRDLAVARFEDFGRS